MNWDDLRFFLALAREGTVSGAGNVLGVKHTTVARRIAVFEDQLGSRLFDRTPSGYTMTQAGENLVSHAIGMEELANTIDRQVFGMDAQLEGTLRIASSYDIFTKLITPNINAFIEKYPAIELEFVASTGLVDLGSRQADIALRISPKPPENLVGRAVAPLGHGIYASEQYLIDRPSCDTLILWGHDKPSPAWVTEHFPDARVLARASEILTMMAIVKNSQGIARMPCYIGDSEPGIKRLDISLDWSGWSMWVLSHVDLRSTARVRVGREFLIDVVEQQRVLIEGRNSDYQC